MYNTTRDGQGRAGSCGPDVEVVIDARSCVLSRWNTRSAHAAASPMAEAHARLLEEIAGHLIEIHTLIGRIASDEFTAAEREELRRLASHDGVPRVFELSNYLYRCCGEGVEMSIESSRGA